MEGGLKTYARVRTVIITTPAAARSHTRSFLYKMFASSKASTAAPRPRITMPKRAPGIEAIDSKHTAIKEPAPEPTKLKAYSRGQFSDSLVSARPIAVAAAKNGRNKAR